MVGRSCGGLAGYLLLPALGMVLLLVGPGPGSRAARAQEARLAAHLAGGEFAPALQVARGLPDREDRDRWIAQIALAQARAGAHRAAVQTAGEISDDRVRAQALSAVAAVPAGGRGGAALADFQSLIDLIQNTVAPETWDVVGGPGTIAPFPTGVLVGPGGLLEPWARESEGHLPGLRAAAAARNRWDDARRPSPLRKISLPRLEKYVQLRLASGQEPTETMEAMAGLTRIQYLFVYPDSGDLVLAGPAGDWTVDEENRAVSRQTGQPVVRLDDLVVVLRRMMEEEDAEFGCMINPTQEGLARTQAFLEESGKRPLPPGQRARRRWLEQLRSQMGKQDIEVFGLDPQTRAARVMVEADYRMKRVGLGLEETVPGLESYLDCVVVPPGQSPPPMSVLRWWFTLDYQAIQTTEDHHAFAVRGQGVKVLSENEKLGAGGTRIHTGRSELVNLQFARGFTRHFEALCRKYPVYAELRNLFDLALVASLIRAEGLGEKVGWHMTCFGDPGGYPVARGPAPKRVETVINHRIVNRVHILAAVSGGVLVAPGKLVAPEALETEAHGPLTYRRASGQPAELPPDAWWWD